MSQKEKQWKDMFPLGLPKLEPIPGTDNYRLVADFAYTRPDGTGEVIPKGFVLDGASIPRLCWRLVGHPFDPDYICAAVVHDWKWRRARTWKDLTEGTAIFAEILERQKVVSRVTRCELLTGVALGKPFYWLKVRRKGRR